MSEMRTLYWVSDMCNHTMFFASECEATAMAYYSLNRSKHKFGDYYLNKLGLGSGTSEFFKDESKDWGEDDEYQFHGRKLVNKYYLRLTCGDPDNLFPIKLTEAEILSADDEWSAFMGDRWEGDDEDE